MRDPSNRRPRYTPDTSKAAEVILWLAQQQPGIDIYHLVKAAFFADKWHVAQYGRPVVGDDYQAAPYGPLPRVIFGLLRHDPLEILALDSNGRLPFEIADKFTVRPAREPNLRWLSESDRDALQHGLDAVKDKTFDDLVGMTHADPAYVNADGGMLDYRDFLPEDDPDREEKARDLSEIARYAVL